MDGRPDKTVPGLFRCADVRQSRAPPNGRVHAGRLQADRDRPAAAEGQLRRMVGAGDLLRVLSAGVRLRQPAVKVKREVTAADAHARSFLRRAPSWRSGER